MIYTKVLLVSYTFEYKPKYIRTPLSVQRKISLWRHTKGRPEIILLLEPGLPLVCHQSEIFCCTDQHFKIHSVASRFSVPKLYWNREGCSGAPRSLGKHFTVQAHIHRKISLGTVLNYSWYIVKLFFYLPARLRRAARIFKIQYIMNNNYLYVSRSPLFVQYSFTGNIIWINGIIMDAYGTDSNLQCLRTEDSSTVKPRLWHS